MQDNSGKAMHNQPFDRIVDEGAEAQVEAEPAPQEEETAQPLLMHRFILRSRQKSATSCGACVCCHGQMGEIGGRCQSLPRGSGAALG